MSTKTQFNPNLDLNAKLLSAGASKTVYALVTPENEELRRAVLADPHYHEMFREAWTGKQDASHEDFFSTWHEWSAPVIDLDRKEFPFYYPCNGASEALRQLIFDCRVHDDENRIHFFRGEYEGYRAMAEAANLTIIEHDRDEWRDSATYGGDFAVLSGDLFFISQPSAIDGNVWPDFNEFLAAMPQHTVVVDLTYVGAIAPLVGPRFAVSLPSVHSVVFSLSKPFGVYYDRIGGVFCRNESLALFGNRWFKNLNSLTFGTELLLEMPVFFMAKQYAGLQRAAIGQISQKLGLDLVPSDVVILANGLADDSKMGQYLNRAGRVRVCITPALAYAAGTAS